MDGVFLVDKGYRPRYTEIMSWKRTEGVASWMYRAMRPDSEGRPELGSTARMLGARPGRDIPVDDDGCVHPGPGRRTIS
jgi:hypothetical protein